MRKLTGEIRCKNDFYGFIHRSYCLGSLSYIFPKYYCRYFLISSELLYSKIPQFIISRVMESNFIRLFFTSYFPNIFI